MWNISAEPIPSYTSTAKRAFQRSRRAGGSASPAERQKRTEARSSPAWPAARCAASCSRSLPIMVGTLVRTVGR
jgi:hypothetical protein